jgi:hypothetical protein
MRKLNIIIPTLAVAVAAGALAVRSGTTQPAPSKLVVGIYAPSVEFGTSQQRLEYVQGLAKAIEAQTGVKTEAKSFASFSALKGAGVDFAILDAQCYAGNLGWNVLANARIGDGTSRGWALYASGASSMQELKGKKLAYVQTGCNDNAFIDNAMLESEVDAAFFSGRVGKPDVTAAVAEVASYKGAQAVFAPSGAQKGLSKLFDTGSVPNPAFVQINGKVPSATASSVGKAVTSFGGGGAIGGWSSPSKGPYQGLNGRMGRVVKRGVFAAPDPVRFDVKDVLVEPASLNEAAAPDVDLHFEEPPTRME